MHPDSARKQNGLLIRAFHYFCWVNVFVSFACFGESKEWPFYPPQAVEPPQVQSSGRVQNGVDAFLLAKLEDQELSYSPKAPRETLIRRLYFDLIGLPPSPDKIETFVNNGDPDAYKALVDSLLDDPRHGERWAKFWLDLARYADTAGYEGDPDLPHAWRYRD
ncbi:MAG: DUF1549 domain-containing protein, partial [Verrucomicrobia bacterium]|nr:DUF1549 domain-containing protein [Verrucomicrobiota bacterium]